MKKEKKWENDRAHQLFSKILKCKELDEDEVRMSLNIIYKQLMYISGPRDAREITMLKKISKVLSKKKKKKNIKSTSLNADRFGKGQIVKRF